VSHGVCSAIVIQGKLESWVYVCRRLHGGGEKTGEKERTAIPLSLHVAALFPL